MEKDRRGIFPRMLFHQLDISKGKGDIGKEQLMDQELFNPQSSSVSSSRIIYTPSTFARTSLLHLQEVGSLQAVHPHVSQREDLVSFLCFIVLSGEGELSYEEQTYQLSGGDRGGEHVGRRDRANAVSGDRRRAARLFLQGREHDGDRKSVV